MSKDIIILIPSGRRIKVHCNPDTSILQVLEDVCAKQGIEPSDYDLKHHNHVLDLTTTIRFCNIPNKATLEMVEADKKRIESNVVIGLTLDDGERRTAEFAPNTSLYDIIIALAPSEFQALQNPTISYMRQEVTGLSALKDKTLRQLGLITGRAILRLLDKTQTVQANVSSVYRKAKPEKNNDTLEDSSKDVTHNIEKSKPGPSGVLTIKDKEEQPALDPIKLIKQEKEKLHKEDASKNTSNNIEETLQFKELQKNTSNIPTYPEPSKTVISQENLERRLQIEDEVSFIGSQKAIAYMQPDETDDELTDLPDDFYELTIEEVRKIYHDLQQQRVELENTPLLTATKRDEMQKQASEHLLNTYKNVVVRIQFPDNIILQGVFLPSNTIEDIQNFVKEHLYNPHRPFHIFSTPLKESLNPKTTLLEARFVPCVHMHFKWNDENSSGQPYLKEEIYLKKTSSDAASILASKYRAPSRRKLDNTSDNSQGSVVAGTSKQSKVPKWFKK